MKILIVGGGGREHALAWKAAQSDYVAQVFVAPGNAGTATEPKVSNVDIKATDIATLLDFAKQASIDLTIVGPEAPLVNGIVDEFESVGLTIFGPRKDQAQLEGSKTFSKDFLQRHHIPTAAYATFTDIKQATAYIHQQGAPIVVKADGLAAGKGVVVAQTEQEAIDAVHDMLADNAFGKAGHRVVIEEFLQGEEASFIVMVDGKNILPMASSQDHKARDNGDQGPNTGGMGAYSPAMVIDQAMHDKIMQTVIQPTVAGMAADGLPYTGFLYAGVMISDGVPKVLEFNCRFGDPETQPIMMRLKSDLVEHCLAATKVELNTQTAQWHDEVALGVVMAAGGYPLDYAKGKVIDGLDIDVAQTKVFHAGTALDNDQVVTHGGRVLCVTALGSTVKQAQRHAYDVVNQISWQDEYHRDDIGYRAIERDG